MVLFSKRLRKKRAEQRKEPGYVRTAPFDGRKSVDPEKFVKSKTFRDQLRRLAETS